MLVLIRREEKKKTFILLQVAALYLKILRFCSVPATQVDAHCAAVFNGSSGRTNQ